MVSMIFSASSLGTDSFMTLGALSTNFLESTRLKPSRALISLMTLGLAAASNSLSLRVKSVFSAAAGAASSASSTTVEGAPAAGPAAKPPTGRSGMLRRDWGEGVSWGPLGYEKRVVRGFEATFKLATRSAVSNSVNWLIWSTMPAILGLGAASVELFRRAIRCRRPDDAARRGEDVMMLARSWRAQHCAPYLQKSDIFKAVEEGDGAALVFRSVVMCFAYYSWSFFWPPVEKSPNWRAGRLSDWSVCPVATRSKINPATAGAAS